MYFVENIDRRVITVIDRVILWQTEKTSGRPRSISSRSKASMKQRSKISPELPASKTSLYSHYKSKNEIILDVLSEQAAIINGALDETLYDLKDAPIDILLRDVF